MHLIVVLEINRMRKDLLALLSYSITNIATTLLLKLSGTVVVQEDGKDRGFFHPFMQTEIMIIGEALCIVPYLLFQKNHKQPSPSKLPSKVSLCLLPLSLDLSSSILIFVAFNYLSGSVYSVLAGEVIVFTAIFSRIFLKSRITRAQVMGSILTVISAVLAGVGESFGDQTSEELDLLVLGIALVTIAMALQAVQVVVYENIYTKYDISALEMVGYQGVIGTAFWTALLVITKFVGCPFSPAQCVFDSDGYTHLQDFSTFFSEIGANTYLLVLNITFLFTVARFNYDQSTVIVTANAFTLCIIRIFSNSLVWVIGIVLTVIGDGKPEFELQSLNWTVIGVKMGAFVLSAVGLLIYYELLCKQTLAARVASEEEDLLSNESSTKAMIV